MSSDLFNIFDKPLGEESDAEPEKEIIENPYKWLVDKFEEFESSAVVIKDKDFETEKDLNVELAVFRANQESDKK